MVRKSSWRLVGRRLFVVGFLVERKEMRDGEGGGVFFFKVLFFGG